MAKKKDEQTADGLPLVAVDMGSSSFKFVAAELTESSYPSTIRILASEVSSKYSGVVKKGVIQNTSNASYRLRDSLRQLGNRMGRKEELPTAFTLYGGKSLRCVDVAVKRSQGTMMPVSQKTIDGMREECIIKVGTNDKTICGLDAHLYSLTLDDTEYSTLPSPAPNATRLQGRFSTFFGSLELRDRVQGSFDRAGKSIEQAFARPAALVEALATEEDEISGLGIIDMGAQTTTITIYKNGRYLSCKTLPFGGENITNDISALGISIENAEKLKLRYGSAIEPKHKDDKTIRIRAVKEDEQPVLVKTSFLSKIITSRLNEIMRPILLELNEWDDQISKVYLTGGASKMADIVEYVQSFTALPVSYGSHADWLAAGTDIEWQSPEYSALIGSLLLGAKYREQHPGKALNKTPIVKKGILERLGDLFTAPTN